MLQNGCAHGKGTQCQKAGNMQRALVKANAQNDEVQVTTKVTQQGQFALSGKERVCPAGKQANPLLHQFSARLHLAG